MALLLAVALCSSPLILTALVLSRLGIFPRGYRGGFCINFAISCYLGQILMAGIIRLIDELNQHWVLPYVLGSIVIVTLTLVAEKYIKGAASQAEKLTFAAPQSPAKLLAAAVLVLMASHIVYQSRWIPSQAWDSLSFWNETASRYIEFFVGQVREPTGHAFPYTNRHPQTAMILAAWPAWIQTYSVKSHVAYIYWVIAWASAGSLVYGFARWKGIGHIISILLGYTVLSIPLIENHALLGGYADLHMAIGLLSACVVIVVWLEGKNWPRMLLALGLALSLFTLKNVGPFYGVLVLIALLVTRLRENYTSLLTICCVAVPFALLLISGQKLNLHVFDNPLYLDVSGGQLYFAGRTLELQYTEPAQIFKNTIVALALNSTFQILCFFYILFIVARKMFMQSNGDRFLFLVVTLGAVALIATQYSDYGLRYATVGNDTGNSRFFMPIFALIPLLMTCLLDQYAHASSKARSNIQSPQLSLETGKEGRGRSQAS